MYIHSIPRNLQITKKKVLKDIKMGNKVGVGKEQECWVSTQAAFGFQIGTSLLSPGASFNSCLSSTDQDRLWPRCRADWLEGLLLSPRSPRCLAHQSRMLLLLQLSQTQLSGLWGSYLSWNQRFNSAAISPRGDLLTSQPTFCLWKCQPLSQQRLKRLFPIFCTSQPWDTVFQGTLD